ncbi:MAG: potassium-transporting ATPase subunit KdpC [Acidobacteria bacterium]|nr:potassium-transporting ATPase subunit KdpC [Acidobacteriota bacterium]
MIAQLKTGLLMTLVLTVLTGLVYPLVVTGLSQVMFRDKANGSLIVRDGKVIGSELLAQKFTKPEYFHPRPSAAGSDGYDAASSSGSNLGPTNKKLADRVKASVEAFRKDNPDFAGPIPADMLTTSASGLDPHISPAAAAAQLPRVAKARGMSPESLRMLVAVHTERPDLGILGEARVNVLLLNLDLDAKGKK